MSVSDTVDIEVPRGGTLLVTNMQGHHSDNNVNSGTTIGIDSHQTKKPRTQENRSNSTSTSKSSQSKRNREISSLKQCSINETIPFAVSKPNEKHDVGSPNKERTDETGVAKTAAVTPVQNPYKCEFCGGDENECHDKLYGEYAKEHTIFQLKNKASKEISPALFEKWFQDAYHTSYDLDYFRKHGKKCGYEFRRLTFPECIWRKSFGATMNHLWKTQCAYMRHQRDSELEEVYSDIDSNSI